MSLNDELQTEQVTHLNLSKFCQAESNLPVSDVLALMRQEGSAVCLVLENGRLAGIFTERDVIQKVVSQPDTWSQPVSTVMTADPFTIRPDMKATAALVNLDEYHFRSLPVVDEDGRIFGTMTHRAIIEYLATRYPIDVLNRPPRPKQFPRKAEGG
jgi:signal-transduction protein with cAMP-binding, CBS, and nucleotidyltransferase domain